LNNIFDDKDIRMALDNLALAIADEEEPYYTVMDIVNYSLMLKSMVWVITFPQGGSYIFTDVLN